MTLSESQSLELAFMQYADLFTDAHYDSFVAGWEALMHHLGGPDHILKVWPDGVRYTVKHPVTERLGKDLFACQMGQLGEAVVEDVGPGFYRIWLDRGALLWDAIPDAR